MKAAWTIFLIYVLFSPVANKGNIKGAEQQNSSITKIPNDIDTNRVFLDQNNNPLNFRQYFDLLLNGRATFRFNERGKYLWVRPGDQLSSQLLNAKLGAINTLDFVYTQLRQADKILVVKHKRLLYFQKSSKTFLTFRCALGRSPIGDKEREGDMKTPEGTYRMVGKTTQVKYHKGYLISYPDPAHIVKASKMRVSPGDQIMVHGSSEKKKQLKDWTNGCIAISNAGMDSLFKYVTPGTPIEIRE